MLDFSNINRRSVEHFTLDQHHTSVCANKPMHWKVSGLFLLYELKPKTRTLQKEEDYHHNVYVVLLSDAVTKHPSILRLNPNRDPLKPCVYVGMTGIPVEHRFENHRNGYKSAWVVRKYGVRLMAELYEHLNPMPFEAAVQMETELADELRAAGYTVTGGH
jgi:predicted GIY-YIG superfamily endonuclease